ncbi:MAG: hypothetical protein V3S64_02785 [bacterium]
MEDTVLIGEGPAFKRISTEAWKKALTKAPGRIAPRLEFMGEAHHLVRNFVVRRLPAAGAEGLSPEFIARELNLSTDRCEILLDELERNLFFLVRDPSGQGSSNVTWAFPVTVEPTPHRIGFSTGESTYGA